MKYYPFGTKIGCKGNNFYSIEQIFSNKKIGWLHKHMQHVQKKRPFRFNLL